MSGKVYNKSLSGKQEGGLVQPAVQILSTTENLMDAMIKFITDLGISLSTCKTAAAIGDTNGSSKIEGWLDSLPKKIRDWYPDSHHGSAETVEYVETIEETQKLIESLGCFPLNGYQEKYELLKSIHDIPQMVISNLKRAFNHIVSENRKRLEPEGLPFQSSNDDVYFGNLIASVEDEH